MRGEKGVIYDTSEKCSSPRILSGAKRRGAPALPHKTIPRVRDGDPFQEWIRARKGGPKPVSNFDYAGPLTEMVQLGNVAIRARGGRIQWDPVGMRIPDHPELDQYLRPSLRQW